MSGFLLKLIAVAAMAADHIGLVLFPHALWLRLIGRIAFPLYAYFIAEGFRHTADVRKYILRLAAFAFLSELPFDLVMTGDPLSPRYQNVFFTLLLGLLAIVFYDRFSREASPSRAMLPVLLCATGASLIPADYGFYGVLLIFVFYICKNQTVLVKWFMVLVPAGALLCYAEQGSLLWSFAQMFELGALPLILTYNGKRGPKVRYFFYVFYPAHLLLLYLISAALKS